MRYVNEILLLWLLACAWTDWRGRRVPNVLSYGLAMVALGALLIGRQTLLGQPAWVGWVGGGVALLITLPGFLRHQLGGGDVKLLAALGLAVGPLLVLLSWIAALPGLLLWSRLRPDPSRRLPLVPALAMGYVVAWTVSRAGWL